MGQLTGGSGDVRGINAIILPVSVVDLSKLVLRKR
jgi:hypothetical protein